MYEWIAVSENCFYMDCPAKVGLVRLDEKRAVLIDSGNDADAGKKALRHIQALGLTLTAIYNTHSHADHIGGNAYLQKNTGCNIYAPGRECCFTNHPVLEPAFLYGGRPPKELCHKFLMAKESKAAPLTEDCLPEGFSAIPLPGHSFDMVGYRTAEDVVYLGDCLSAEETLEKYAIGFLYDVSAYLDTLERVAAMEARYFVPAHAPATDKIAPLARYNIAHVQRIAEQILRFCKEPIAFTDLLARVFSHYGLRMDFTQHALVGSTLRSYLTWLKEQGALTAEFENNRLLWMRC